jgi:chaperonin GroES
MSVNNIKPMGNRVLVKRSQVKATKGGILLPDSAQEKPKQGEVIAIGPGKTEDDGKITPMNVRIGDQVLFSAYAGSEIKSDEQGVEYLIMSEDDVLGILV